MLYLAHKLLKIEEVKSLRKRLLLSPEWVDGKNTAKGQARDIKRNLQLKPSKVKDRFSEEIIEAIKENELIESYAFPSKIFNILFSRVGVGMYYGSHVDAPYIKQGLRHLSFTIFLNDPNEYKGGELILNIPPERKTIKLNAGEIIIYPTTYLHEVKEVTEGERMVCVGWIQSQIARDGDRSSLFMLKESISQLINTKGNSPITENLTLAYNNIYRRFIS